MSILHCDMCDRRVDTDEDVEGAYDDEQGIYSCSKCQLAFERRNGFVIEPKDPA